MKQSNTHVPQQDFIVQYMYLENQPQNLQMQQESQIQVSFCKVNTAHSPYTTLVLALETESNNVLNLSVNSQ